MDIHLVHSILSSNRIELESRSIIYKCSRCQVLTLAWNERDTAFCSIGSKSIQLLWCFNDDLSWFTAVGRSGASEDDGIVNQRGRISGLELPPQFLKRVRDRDRYRDTQTEIELEIEVENQTRFAELLLPIYLSIHPCHAYSPWVWRLVSVSLLFYLATPCTCHLPLHHRCWLTSSTDD